ncbi:MAG: hypothetical protein IJW26_05745 [Clostridia bacterium]|nr:hypothetical protein [Clostridia bacterium]
MIRDEFNKKKQENLSSKEIKQIRKLGERAYYVSSVNKLKDNIRLFNFSTLLGIIFCAVPLVYLIDATFFIKQDTVKALIGFIAVCLVYLWALVWFVIVKPIMKNKLKKYQNKLQEITQKEVQKFKK